MDILQEAEQVVAEAILRIEIKAAIKISQGDDHVVTEIDDQDFPAWRFPAGTRCWLVGSQHPRSKETHELCYHYYTVFSLNGIYVVLAGFEARTATDEEIIRALTDDDQQQSTK